MRDFWKVFEKTAYFRISWSIQDSFLNFFQKNKKNALNKRIQENSEDIKNKVYNNPFYKNRQKK